MDPQIYIVIAIIAAAGLFIALRIWRMLRVARGDKACNACGCEKAADMSRS
ncbi:MAG: hypothetical protein IT462_05510 [Planctomycetes bacterium]|nr:hypothetical protein [Planctomycetota bacterium]